MGVSTSRAEMQKGPSRKLRSRQLSSKLYINRIRDCLSNGAGHVCGGEEVYSFENADCVYVDSPTENFRIRFNSLHPCCHCAPATKSPSFRGKAAGGDHVWESSRSWKLSMVRPNEMIKEIQDWPHPTTLSRLKECLDFNDPSWISMFLSLGGAELLLEVFLIHIDALHQDFGDAQSGILATLECLQSLLHGASGLQKALLPSMENVLNNDAFMSRLCCSLGRVHVDATKLLLDILKNLCVSSADGQMAVLAAFLEDKDAEHTQTSEENSTPTAVIKQSLMLVPCSSPGAKKKDIVSQPLFPSLPDTSCWKTRSSLVPPPPPLPCSGRKRAGCPPPAPAGVPKQTAGFPASTPPPVSRTAAPNAGQPKTLVLTTIDKTEDASGHSHPIQCQSTLSAPSGSNGYMMDAEGPSTSSTGTLCKLGAKMPPVPPPLPMHISKGLSRPSPAKHTQHKNSESAADWVSHVDERKKPEDLCPPAAPPPPIHLPRKLYAETIPSHSKRTEIRKPDSARSHPVSTSTEPVLSVGESKSPIEAKADCATQSSSKASVGGSRLVSGVQTSASTEAVKDFASMFAVTDAESFDHDKILCSSLLMLGMLDGHGDGPNDDLQRMLVMQLNECGILANLHDLAEIGNSSMKDKVQECASFISSILKELQPEDSRIPTVEPIPLPPPPPLLPPKLAASAPRAPIHVPPRVPAGPQPSKKMKNFFWDKIPDNRIDGTFWEDHLPSVWLSFDELETLFQAPQRSKGLKAKAENVGSTKKLAVLDLKRATGIGIRMARLPVPWVDIRDAILTCDEEVLRTCEDVQTVLACIPNEEEKRMLESFLQQGGKLSDLSEAELFALELARVPRCEARLRTFQSRFTALVSLQEAQEILKEHSKAAAELQSSKSFADVLQAALAIGNFLNWGSARGQAAGFRLRGLNKLQDTRSLDGRISLTVYLAKSMFARNNNAPILNEDLKHVSGNRLKIPLSEVSEMMETVTSAMHDCHHELRITPSRVFANIHVKDDKTGIDDRPVSLRILVDSYNEIMTEVCDAVHQQQADLQSAYQSTRAGFNQVVEFFGENVAALTNESDFWNDLLKFVNEFSAAQRECLKAKELEEERLQRKANKESRKCTFPGSRQLTLTEPEETDRPAEIVSAEATTCVTSPSPLSDLDDASLAQFLANTVLTTDNQNPNSCHGMTAAAWDDSSSMVSSPAKQPGAHPNMGSCPAESSEPITNRTGMQTKLPYLSRSNINASLAGLPLSSFKAVKQLQRAQRGIASPLAELPLNSTENEKHNHSLQEAGLNILLQQTPPASALPGPEIVDSPCLPEATENTPIPYIKSRAAHFGNPHPRGSIICWATADSNPAFGLPDSPTGSEESTSTFSTPLSMKSNCYRSQTPISPMHGPDRDCGKCKRSTEEEVSSCIISSSQIDFQNLCSTRSAFQCDCIASEDGMQDRKYDKLSPVMTDSSKEGCHSEHENQPASSAPSLKLLASLGLVQFAVRADKV